MKNPSNGNIKVTWILDEDLANPEAPDAADLNAALDLSPAIAWDSYDIAASESGDLDDRAIVDLGNAISRGAASYGATLAMFRDRNNTDLESVYVQAFEAFREELTLGWLVVRVNTPWSPDYAGGDVVSLYRLIAATVGNDTEGEDSTKFTVEFMPQGRVIIHTRVAGAGAISGIEPTKAATAGQPYQLLPVLAGKSILSVATYESSDPAVARVSKGGTVVPVGTGTADITVSHPAATAPVIQEVTVS